MLLINHQGCGHAVIYETVLVGVKKDYCSRYSSQEHTFTILEGTSGGIEKEAKAWSRFFHKFTRGFSMIGIS